MNNNSAINWKFITQTIRNEKCILFIGPELFKDKDGLSLEEQLSKELNISENPNIQKYYKDEGLFLFTGNPEKTYAYYTIKNFYNKPFLKNEEILKDLIKIPFHVIISITPDNKFRQLFKSLGYEPNFSFYWKKQGEIESIENPSIKSPIIYNMFGSIDVQESLVLSHDDLFDYFESIFKEDSMPKKITKKLKEADNIIFLGLDFEKWYMQLLLRILKINDKENKFIRYAANQKLSDEIQQFCLQQFKIQFVPTKIEEFVKELLGHCENEGLIRKKAIKQISKINRLKNLFSDDRIEEIFIGLKDFFEELGINGNDLANSLLLLESRFKRLNREKGLGKLDSRDFDVGSNLIRSSLLDLINEAKNLE
ncbi:MAG TPA: SIR2 family protein [Saprospiraceae bacterium]|nr:SIR2 family protein [Saprospiraceae bacterium]